ncbi:ACT domain-containing protein [Microbispora sp. NBC_01389]|uniref:ACT domain-containing protein n=1 Tax=Microbispora sp. NBC_01389 TaxID=2903584 RepID=UPI00324AAC9E
MSEPRNAAGEGGHPAPGPLHRHHGARSWRREIAELAALFLAVGLAHVLATLLGHRDPGPVVLVSIGLALIVGSAVHKRLSAPGAVRGRVRPGTDQATSLWRVRARVAERPGRLAALAGAFARLGCNILSLQIAPAGSAAMARGGCDALDEFVVEAPASLTPQDLWRAVDRAGGVDAVVVPAQVKDLIDPGIQALLLGQRVRDDPGELLAAMTELLRTADVRWREPGEPAADRTPGTVMTVPVHPGATLVVTRRDLPFTPTEAARAAALAAAARHRQWADDWPGE